MKNEISYCAYDVWNHHHRRDIIILTNKKCSTVSVRQEVYRHAGILLYGNAMRYGKMMLNAHNNNILARMVLNGMWGRQGCSIKFSKIPTDIDVTLRIWMILILFSKMSL